MIGQFKFAALIAVSSLAALTSAQFSGFPTCGLECANGFASESACGTDVSCLCADQTFIDAAASCIYTTCPRQDQPSSIGRLREACEAAPPYTPSSSAASSSATGSAAPTGSSSVSGSSVPDVETSTTTSSAAPITIPDAAVTSITSVPPTTRAAAATTPAVTTGSTRRTSASGTSTQIVVQTETPEDSALSGAAGLDRRMAVVLGAVVGGAVMVML